MTTAARLRTGHTDVVRLAVWGLTAVAVGCFSAVIGLPSIYVLIAASGLVVAGAVILREPVFVLCASVWLLGLVPFSWGLKTDVLPKLFGDEVLLLVYLSVFPLLCIFGRRAWQCGFGKVYSVLSALLLTQLLSLAPAAHDLIAIRNLVETFVLGALLVVLFMQEFRNTNAEIVASSIAWLTAVISGLSLVEWAVQRNPVMERVTDILYLSPQLAQITNGVYRPYVSFFHPSETGTFIGLGVPFVLRMWMQKKSLTSSTLILVCTGALLVNATRGVWVAVATACVLLMPNAMLFLGVFIPIAAVAATGFYLALKDTPFMQRLTDPNNLLSRFESWKLALKVFGDHPFLGVGHMQFKQVYLSYVQDLSNSAHFDIAKVYVVDNMYLTVLVEHGAIGLAGLIATMALAFFGLSKLRRRLIAEGRCMEASLVRASQLAVVLYAVTGCFADVNLFTKATKFMFIIVGLGFAMGARKSSEVDSAAGFLQRRQVRS